VSPATVADARGMLWIALQDPDPVLIFEPIALYNAEGELSDDAAAVDIERAAVRRPGSDVTVVTYGGALHVVEQAAEQLAGEGISTEVVDLRALRPLDEATIFASVARTHRLVVVDEGWRSVGIAAEIAARAAEHVYYDLDAPIARVCTAEVPIPYARQLEEAALPQPAAVAAAVREAVR
ncbi:transketolase C-terminal domain-containing protein, partial [Nocardia gipuzkoensis]